MRKPGPVIVLMGLQVLAGGVLACAGGTPAPGGTTPLDARTPEEIRAYVTRLTFDERKASGDERTLPVGCPSACRPGPVVAIQPEENTHHNSSSDLAGSPGRIVARLINRDTLQGYPPLNLAPGDTVYWAVDSVRPIDRDSSRGNSLWISAAGLRGDKSHRTIREALHIEEHPDQPPYKQALARWYEVKVYTERETPGGGVRDAFYYVMLQTWGNCTKGSCCQ